MRPTFESIKKLSEKITFGKGLDNKKQEPVSEDQSNKENHLTPQNHESKEQPNALNNSNQLNPDAPPSRKKRTVVRLCHYCNEFFEAHRNDANYCSASHRQMANKKGIAYKSFGNPSEHFLKKAIIFYIGEILRWEEEEISNHKLENWYKMIVVARVLFLNNLHENNKLVLFYKNHIEGFLGYISKQSRNINSNQFILNIPPGTKEIWQKFLDASA